MREYDSHLPSFFIFKLLFFFIFCQLLATTCHSPGNDLLVHVIEQLSPTVLVDDGAVGRVEGVHEVPVPVVEVDADVLAEVRHALFRFLVACCVVYWDCYGQLWGGN